MSLTLKLDGTDLDDLRNAAVVDVKPLRQTLIAEATVIRYTLVSPPPSFCLGWFGLVVAR